MTTGREAAAHAEMLVHTREQTEILCALARIDARLDSGDSRFSDFRKHVEECSEEKRTLTARLSALEGRVSELGKSLGGLRAAVYALVGAVFVVGGGLVGAIFIALSKITITAG